MPFMRQGEKSHQSLDRVVIHIGLLSVPEEFELVVNTAGFGDWTKPKGLKATVRVEAAVLV